MTDWNAFAKALLRSEMTQRKITAAELAKLLDQIGIHENERNLGNKIARGTFSAAFLLQCLVAMKVQTLRIGDGSIVG
jgi:hypothetical protein